MLIADKARAVSSNIHNQEEAYSSKTLFPPLFFISDDAVIPQHSLKEVMVLEIEWLKELNT